MAIWRMPSFLGYIISLGCAILTFIFYMLVINVEERYFTVLLDSKFDAEFTATTLLPQTVHITVKGGSATLARIDDEDISALVDFSIFITEGPHEAPVQIIKHGVFQNVDNVEVSVIPSVINMNIEQKIVRPVRISPSFSNVPPPGYLFGKYNVVPSMVNITGARSVVESISNILTQEINLANADSDFSRRVVLVFPNNTAITTDKTEATVHVNINVVMVVRTFNDLSILIRNFVEGFILDRTLPSITLVMRGQLNAFENFIPEIVLDMASIKEAGEYLMSPVVTIPRNMELISMSPDQVSILVTSSDEQNTIQLMPTFSLHEPAKDVFPTTEPLDKEQEKFPQFIPN